MSPVKAVALCFVLALAFAAKEEQSKPQKAKAGGFQCTPLGVSAEKHVDLMKLSGERSTTYFEVASSKATQEAFGKGCSCWRSEFKYMRFADHEKLLVNDFCNVAGEEHPARYTGVMVPVKEVSAKALLNPIRAGNDNTGTFAYIITDVDDPRLPEELQDKWSELRKERLQAWFSTLPKDVKQAIVEHKEFKKYHPDIELEDIEEEEEAVKESKPKEAAISEEEEEEKPHLAAKAKASKAEKSGEAEEKKEAVKQRLSPLRRLMAAQQQKKRGESTQTSTYESQKSERTKEESVKQESKAQYSPRAKQQKAKAAKAKDEGQPAAKAMEGEEEAKITEGPLLELDPEKELQLMEVQILAFDPEKKCMIVASGCKEFVSILAAEPENVTEEDINKAIEKLEELGFDKDELNISRVDVDSECVQEVKQEEEEMEAAIEEEPTKEKEEEEPKTAKAKAGEEEEEKKPVKSEKKPEAASKKEKKASGSASLSASTWL